jgi:hypothetical protein
MKCAEAVAIAVAQIQEEGGLCSIEEVRKRTGVIRGQMVSVRTLMRPLCRSLLNAGRDEPPADKADKPKHPRPSPASETEKALAKALARIAELEQMNAALLQTHRDRRERR